MKSIILKIDNQSISYNNNDCVPIKNTNLPYNGLTFSEVDIYWLVELYGYDKETGNMNVRVKDYHHQNFDEFPNQVNTKPVSRILFDPMNWDEVRTLLSNYALSLISESFYNLKKTDLGPTSGESGFRNRKYSRSFRDKLASLKNETTHESENQILQTPEGLKTGEDEFMTYSITVTRKITDMIFGDGMVSTDIYVSQISSKETVNIYNDHIKKEFEYIKGYFKHKFDRAIKIDVSYVVDSEKLIDINASSSDIDKINDSMIEEVKVRRINILDRVIKKDIKPILKLEDIFEVLDERSSTSNVFNQSELDILFHFINTTKIRNKGQLKYLALKLHNSQRNILFTLNPRIGFIFHFEINSKRYFIWELLNSNATYIWWTQDQQISHSELIKKLETAIEYIKTLGRSEYKKAYSEKKINTDIFFKSISHSLDSAHGFENWKNRLSVQVDLELHHNSITL